MAEGVQAGDHVALWLNNRDDWVFLALAVVKIGAVLVPVNTRFRTHDLDYVLRQSDSGYLITHDTCGPIDYLSMVREVVKLPGSGYVLDDPSFPMLRKVIILGGEPYAGTVDWRTALARAAEVQPADLAARTAMVKPEDPALIMYTSGTTGFPKGAMHCHNLIRNVAERGFRFNITPRDTILGYLPLFHAFGFSEGMLMSLVTGAKHIVTETFDPSGSLDLVEQEGVSIVQGFDAHVKGLCEAQEARPRDISTLRTGIFGAGPLSTKPIMYRGAKTLAPVRSVSGFGMTETWIGVAMNGLDDPPEERLEANGTVGLGYEFRVADPETATPLPHGQEGELQVRGRYLMMGYYKKPDETRASYTPDGWFKTGDAAVHLPDGSLHFLGRYKDMLKVGGENVDPMEVEGLLREHDAIHEAAVVGCPDEKLAEVAVAYVQKAPGAEIDEDEVIAFCRGKVASFKIPRHVVFMEAFPMTASGKIRKVELRDDARERFGGG
jgi:fatty-acyl-CoA synthase